MEVGLEGERTMTFDEVLAQVKTLLQQEQRVSYRGLKRRFALDDEYLEDLKEELIGAKHLAIDEDGRFLVWIGNSSLASRVQSLGTRMTRCESLRWCLYEQTSRATLDSGL